MMMMMMMMMITIIIIIIIIIIINHVLLKIIGGFGVFFVCVFMRFWVGILFPLSFLYC